MCPLRSDQPVSTAAPSGRPRGDPPADEPRTTPPAWDPLGVAPFAWDLPDPTPVVSERRCRATGPGPGVIGRATIGIALVAGSIAAVGVFAGWFR